MLLIETSVEKRGEMEVAGVGTSQQRWGVGAAYRMAFGSSVNHPTLTLVTGYSTSSFAIDKASVAPVEVDLPNTQYSLLSSGARFRVGVGSGVALHAEARYLYVLATGEMQRVEAYGGAMVTGVDGELGLEYRISPQLLVRFAGRYTALGYEFIGDGESTDRDGDGEMDVGGALDSYVSGTLTVGAGF